jgi:hypothetical protein
MKGMSMKIQKVLFGLLAAALVVGGLTAHAASRTVTNSLGQAVTVYTLEADANSGTVTQDQSVYPTPTDRRGIYVVHYAVPATGITGATEIAVGTLPKGSILTGGAVVEKYTALLPAAATNTLTVGGVTPCTNLHTAAGVMAPAPLGNSTPLQTTSAGKLTLNTTGGTLTSGVFTVYLPILYGNAD